MDEKTSEELHYLIGRLIGLRTRLGQDIDTVIYYEQYRIRIDTVPSEARVGPLGNFLEERKEVVRSTKKD